jgi:hypothetical protein
LRTPSNKDKKHSNNTSKKQHKLDNPNSTTQTDLEKNAMGNSAAKPNLPELIVAPQCDTASFMVRTASGGDARQQQPSSPSKYSHNDLSYTREHGL